MSNIIDSRIQKAVDILYTIPDMSDLTKQKVCDYMTREMSSDIARQEVHDAAEHLNETHLYKIYAKKLDPTCFYIPLFFYCSGEKRMIFRCHKYYFQNNHYMAVNIDSTKTLYDQIFDDVFEEVTFEDVKNRISKFSFINSTAVIEDMKEKIKNKTYSI